MRTDPVSRAHDDPGTHVADLPTRASRPSNGTGRQCPGVTFIREWEARGRAEPAGVAGGGAGGMGWAASCRSIGYRGRLNRPGPLSTLTRHSTPSVILPKAAIPRRNL